MSARDDAVSAATAAYGDGGYGHAHRMNKAIAAYEAALSAAGWLVVPREPTREMWAAAGNALVNGRVKLRAHHDYLSETVWSAMIAAQEGK